MSWLEEGEGPIYVPALKVAEGQWNIPPLLLCRISYQESHFRKDIIEGPPNSAGCIGLMQLNTRYYPNAGQDTARDIQDAAQLLRQDYVRFNDWQLAVASYNWGPGNVHKWQSDGSNFNALPLETQNYLLDVNTDVPITGSILSA